MSILLDRLSQVLTFDEGNKIDNYSQSECLLNTSLAQIDFNVYFTLFRNSRDLEKLVQPNDLYKYTFIQNALSRLFHILAFMAGFALPRVETIMWEELGRKRGSKGFPGVRNGI